MEFIREIRRVEDNTITIQLPENYRDKEVEVLVLPFEDSKESESVKTRSFESLKHISLDTRNYKFNRTGKNCMSKIWEIWEFGDRPIRHPGKVLFAESLFLHA
ncbi:MAG: hypothetical protein PVH61_32925 [Candidatus Aminicenantes bacterium]